jgi:hypothetical protein
MTAKEIYEKQTGIECETNQLAFGDWYIGYVRWLEQQVVKMFTKPEVSNQVCRTFVPDMSLTTATKCKVCGKEKWQH